MADVSSGTSMVDQYVQICITATQLTCGDAAEGSNLGCDWKELDEKGKAGNQRGKKGYVGNASIELSCSLDYLQAAKWRCSEWNVSKSKGRASQTTGPKKNLHFALFMELPTTRRLTKQRTWQTSWKLCPWHSSNGI
jgi:hypothetical protein